MAKKSAFGSIEKRGHNVYRIKWTASDGKRKSETVHGTKYAAQQRLSEIQLGIHGSTSNMTYAAYWEATVEPSFNGLAAKTVAEYERLWNVELEKRISRRLISETDWKVVQEVIDDIDAPSVQKKCFVLWRKVLNMAIRDRIVTFNPCDRSIRMKQVKKRKKALLEASNVITWMEAIRGLKYEPVLLCLAGGGLRPEESDALTWNDIEPYKYGESTFALVNINKTVVMVNGKKVMQDRTKTAESTREVIIGEPFASRLLELKGDGYICKGANAGECANPSTISHNWKDWCKRNNVEYVARKDLRSSFATMHGEAGNIDSLVSMAMGHSDGTTKGNNYQASTRRGMVMIAENLADYIMGIVPDTSQGKA